MELPNIVKADGYKYSHFLQYRPGTRFVSSYIEARGCDRGWDDMVFAGSRYLLDQYVSKPLVTKQSLARMTDRAKKYGASFNEAGFQYILDKYDGYAPVRIQALDEGTVVPVGTPILQSVNTDPLVPWVTSFMETPLMRIWYPTTVSTLAFQIKRIIRRYMLDTAGHTNGLEYMLHDFGPRGASSSESAQIGGLGHLIHFNGSDNMEAIEMIDLLYGEEMAATSIDAAEHSTITSFGGPEYELEAFTHQLKALGMPGRIFAVVSDTYNIYQAVSEKWGTALRDEIVALGKHGGKLVVRPDSGDPATVVVDILSRLYDAFGGHRNEKGYRVLPPYIGVIQGDGINEVSIEAILAAMRRHGFSAENIAFGMGGALLQGVNRDTLKFAMKASGMQNDSFNGGEWYDVYKDPITDKGKISKKGRQAVTTDEFGQLVTVREDKFLADGGLLYNQNLLEDVYLNGKVLKVDNLATIRERAAKAR